MLEGQVAVVTGATQAIGKEIVRHFVMEGVKLAMMGNTDEIHRLKAELEAEGATDILAFRGNVGNENDVDFMIQAARNAYGRVDILVNNAGIGLFKKIEEITTEEWMKSFEVNVQGVFLAVKAVLPIMKKQQSGTIITISSDAARYTLPKEGTLYTSTKYAVQGLMGSLIQEVRKHGIRAGTINPGLTAVDSDASSPGWLKPEDIAKTCVYLAAAPKHMTIDELQIHPLAQDYPRP